MSSHLKSVYTLEEYIALETASETRYEYWDGEIYLMSGAKPNHNRIAGNVYRTLANQLNGGSCEVFNEGQRILAPFAPPFRYPDVSVVCGEPIFKNVSGLEALANPIVIVEVMSPTSESYDKGQKFEWYQSIPTFREYLLFHQDRLHAIHRVKQPDGTWSSIDITGIDAVIRLESIDCTIVLRDAYERVKFD